MRLETVLSGVWWFFIGAFTLTILVWLHYVGIVRHGWKILAFYIPPIGFLLIFVWVALIWILVSGITCIIAGLKGEDCEPF